MDAWAGGMMTLLLFGRAGCLLSGCCHGRPAASGVRYPWRIWRDAPAALHELSLRPVQLLEITALCLLVAGLFAAASWAADGTGFLLFLSGYSAVRFGLELLRGDRRRYWWLLSESQYLSVAMSAAAIAIALSTAESLWIALACGSGALVMGIVVIAKNRLGPPTVPPLDRRSVTAVVDALQLLVADVSDSPSQGARRTTTPRGLVLECDCHESELTVRYWRQSGRLDRGTELFLSRLVSGVLDGEQSNAG
jgi:hypothetical protein